MTVLSAIQPKTNAVVEPLDVAMAAQKRGVDASGEAAQAKELFAADLDQASKTQTSRAVEDDRPVSAVYRTSKSGVLTPVQQFESFVLRSFVETMLPKENDSFFGTGTAGQIWKSMLAERIGDEMAKDGGIGIAELLEKRHTAGGSAETAKAASAAMDRLSIDATKLQGAERAGQL